MKKWMLTILLTFILKCMVSILVCYLFRCLFFSLVPYPIASNADERLKNIEAIEKDIESRLNITISHIPPQEIMDKNTSAVKHLHELMQAIDEARLGHLSFSKLILSLFISLLRSSQRASSACPNSL